MQLDQQRHRPVVIAMHHPLRTRCTWTWRPMRRPRGRWSRLALAYMHLLAAGGLCPTPGPVANTTGLTLFTSVAGGLIEPS